MCIRDSHNCAFIQIKKEYPLQARRVMHAVWGAGQMAWTKSIVVVDHDVDVHHPEQVWFHVMANADPGRDLDVYKRQEDLRHKVTSPGGTTQAAIEHFHKHGFEQLVRDALRAARDRSVELGKT